MHSQHFRPPFETACPRIGTLGSVL
uniref:Uncharacterized protein n=1 Tax=Arundo donax TaxID=35708 RepID=A0A0A8ZFX4_ARUDO